MHLCSVWMGNHRKTKLSAATKPVHQALDHLLDLQQLGAADQFDEHATVEFAHQGQRSAEYHR